MTYWGIIRGLLIGIICMAQMLGADLANAQTILRIGVNSKSIKRLDPHFAFGIDERILAEMMFNRLIRYVPGTTDQFELDLGESMSGPEIVNGKQAWTFTIKPGIWFHPGAQQPAYELTADDVVASLNKSAKAVNPNYGGDYSDMTAEKLGPYSVRIFLEKPLSALMFKTRLAAYSGGFIVSREAVDKNTYKAFTNHPSGTGPFMFDRAEEGKIYLKANPNYFRGTPRLDGVEMHLLPELTDRETGLITGNLDIAQGISDPAWVRKWQSRKSVAVDLWGTGEIAMLLINERYPPLNDVRVRKAIAYALNRDAFTVQFGKDLVIPVESPVPAQLIPGGMDHTQLTSLKLDYPHDLETAKTLLAEAGYADGFELKLVSSEQPDYRRHYQLLKQQLAMVGIECTIETVRHQAMHVMIRRNEYPLVIYIAWRPDADAILTRYFHSDMSRRFGSRPDANFSQYKKIDRLIEEARNEADAKRQYQLWRYAQIMVLDDMVAYPLHYIRRVFIRKPNVNLGFSYVSPVAFYPLITDKTRLE